MMRRIPDHGLLLDGHDTPRPDVLTQARAHLLGEGMHPLDADDLLVDRKGLVIRAWWAGDQIGFCGEDHPDAQPVTVVHC